LAGLRIVPGILANNRANAEISIIPKITASVQAHYFNKANYTGLTNTIINSYKMVPDSWNQGAAVISNRWAGAVTFAPATTTTANDSFSLLYSHCVPQVPKRCGRHTPSGRGCGRASTLPDSGAGRPDREAPAAGATAARGADS
jgi:hypothetical protein